MDNHAREPFKSKTSLNDMSNLYRKPYEEQKAYVSRLRDRIAALEAANPATVKAMAERLMKLEEETKRLQSVIARKDEAYRSLDGAFRIARTKAAALEALLIDAQKGSEGPSIPLHHHIAEVKKLQDTISAFHGSKT